MGKQNPTVFACFVLVALGVGASDVAGDTHAAITALALDEPPPPAPGLVTPIAADSGSTLGWSFTVDTPVEVTSLGFFDSGLDGLSQPHLVGIWDESQQLLAWAQIDAGEAATISGFYRYASIEPLVLTSGQTYIIGATVPLGTPQAGGPPGTLVADTYPFYNLAAGSLSMDLLINLSSCSLGFWGAAGPGGSAGPGVLAFPDAVVEDGYFFTGNFTFRPVPEPSVAVVLCCGLSYMLRRRRVRSRNLGS